MADFTPVETVVTTDHTEGFHVFGYVLDGAFHPVTALDSGLVAAAVASVDDDDAHPLAVAAAKSGKSSKPNG